MKAKEGDTRRGGVLLTLFSTWIMACENFMEKEKPNMTFFSFQIPYDNCSIEETKEKKRKKEKKETQFLSKTWGGWGWLCF